MDTDQERLITVPRHHDLVADCAEAVVAHFESALPDLRRAVVLLPHHLQQRRLRGCLLEAAKKRGYAAILPPTITTLRNLNNERARAPQEQTVLSEHERKLLLATELNQYPDLLPRTSRWEFAEQLLQLFDEIADAHPQTSPPTLANDQSLVQTLCRAWREDRAQTPDTSALYRNNLLTDALTRDDEHVFACGLNSLSACETAWVKRLHAQCRLTLITSLGEAGRYIGPAYETAVTITATPLALPPTDDALEQLLNATFANDGAIAARARDFAQRFAHSPAAERIRVFKPETLEQHAFGIYTQIRDWIDAGIFPIAVASQDRKLSRRLQAILERDNVPLYDHSGWALSTATSAAVIAALLPPSEQGFDHNTLLALVCSPHCSYGIDVMRIQQVSAQLERALAKMDLFRNFDETMAALATLDFPHDKALGEDLQKTVARIHGALDKLRAVMDERRPFTDLFDALAQAMHELGMTTTLQKDEVGRRLIETLAAMAAAAHTQSSSGWSLWRRWILHNFEREYFIQKEHGHLVEFYGLSQLQLSRPAGLIIAALDTNHTLPKQATPLLDEKERRTLNLKGRHWDTAMRFDHFRTALTGTQNILLSYQLINNGQALTPTPWLDGLQHFHALAYGDDLEEKNLKLRAMAEMRATAETLPGVPEYPEMPSPQLPNWPARLSVGAIQAAVACPYRFYAKASLKLTPAATANHYDSATDFGIRLHRCLTALHSDDDKLPGPMSPPWDESRRDAALALADEIVEAEFASDLSRHYSAAARMQRARDAMRWYVDWLITNTPADAQFETETKLGVVLDDGMEIHGRLDCMIQANGGVHILDYKSGFAPGPKSMKNGEDVQLTAYALFHDQVRAVSYLSMKSKNEIPLADDELEQAREHLRQRLETFKRDAADKPLPAWADDKDCKYCDYPGVCRRSAWRHTL